MPGSIAVIGDAYAALARNVAALNDTDRTKRVADIRTFLSMKTMVPPFCLFVPDLGQLSPPQAIQEGGTVQQEQHGWSAYLGAASFGPEGEGAFEAAAGQAEGEDFASLLDALFAAVVGKTVYGPVDGAIARAFGSSWALYDVTPVSVIYRVQFYNEFVRVV
jgi:hypothetical protein